MFVLFRRLSVCCRVRVANLTVKPAPGVSGRNSSNAVHMYDPTSDTHGPPWHGHGRTRAQLQVAAMHAGPAQGIRWEDFYAHQHYAQAGAARVARGW